MRHVQGRGELRAYRHRGRNKNNSQGNIFLLLFLAASRAGGKDLTINCLQEAQAPDPISLGLRHPMKLSPSPTHSRKGCLPPSLPLSIPGLRSAEASPPTPAARQAPGCTEPTQSILKARGTSLPRNSKAASASGLCPLPAPASAALLLLLLLPLFALAKPRASPRQQSPAALGQAEREGKPEAQGREGACEERRTGREMEK